MRTQSVFSMAEGLLNVGAFGKRTKLQDVFDQPLQKQKQIARIASKLIENSPLYEYVEWNNRPYKSFLVSSLGSPYSRAKLYRDPIVDRLA